MARHSKGLEKAGIPGSVVTDYVRVSDWPAAAMALPKASVGLLAAIKDGKASIGGDTATGLILDWPEETERARARAERKAAKAAGGGESAAKGKSKR